MRSGSGAGGGGSASASCRANHPAGRIALPALIGVLQAHVALAAGWPMWRYDAGRSASSPEELPRTLGLLWSRQLPPAAPAWPASQHKLQFDVCYEPVAAGGRRRS